MAGEIIFDHPPVRARACKHGAMIYYSTDQYIGRSLDVYGEYSEGEVDLFKQITRPGMVVVDVGANIGVFTVYFAKEVGASGRVYSFEPQRSLYYILCGNLALNGLNNVTAIHGALGATPGTIFAPALDFAKGGNFGGLPLGGGTGGQVAGETVGVSTLDALDLERCNLIKIDVEGMECTVLRGAVQTLAKHKPLLYVENDRQENSAELIQWLLDHGYRLYWHLPPLFNPNNYFGEQKEVFSPIISINMFCAPRSLEMRVQLPEIISPDDDWRDANSVGIELSKYNRALAVRPHDIVALNSRGLLLHKQRRFDEALVAFNKALAINPDMVEVLYNCGNTLLEHKRLEEALASYDTALAIKPEYPAALNNRGLALHGLKRSEKALASYAMALAIQPDLAEAHYNRGNALLDLKRYDEALASYDKALAINPDYLAALNNRGWVLQILRRFAEALQSYDRVLAIKPDYITSLTNRDVVMRELEREMSPSSEGKGRKA
jgi:FkbM family methyltransferase